MSVEELEDHLRSVQDVEADAKAIFGKWERA
jgi:hypothetical protein